MTDKAITDQDLLNSLKELVQTERELVAKLLRYLFIVEARKLYLHLGFPSLFSFCVDYLKYSHAEAFTRIQAMRLLRSLPQIEDKIESGALSLTNAAQIQTQFRKEAERRREQLLEPIKLSQKLEIVNEMEKVSTRDCEKKLAQIFPEIQAKAYERTRVLSEEKILIQFAASPELMKKIEKLKGLLAHKNYAGRLDILFEELADIALKKLDPEKQKGRPVRDQVPHLDDQDIEKSLQPSNSAEQSSSVLKNNAVVLRVPQVRVHQPLRRYIPTHIRRKIWIRARGQCEYQSGPQRCSSKHALQLDHILAFAKGGPSTEANLQLLCDQHNRNKGSGFSK